MSGEINRVPIGLLSALDLAARGQTPRQLSPIVNGTVELLPLYLQQNRRVSSSSSSTINAGGFWSVNLDVPQNQIWYVHAYSVQATALPALTSYSLAPAVRVGASGTPQQPLSVIQVFTAGNVVGAFGDRDFWMPPGSAFGLWVSSVTLGTATAFTGVVDYTPLQA